MKKLNQLTEVECDLAQGCANIFDRALPTSENYSPDDSKYAPFQIAEEDEKEMDKLPHFITIRRPETIPQTGDFCVQFTYSAVESALKISLNPREETGITLPLTSKENAKKVHREAQFCVSWLTNQVDQVTSVYFTYSKMPKIYNLDQHTVDLDPTTDITANKMAAAISTGIYINNLSDKLFSVEERDPDSKWNVQFTNDNGLSNRLEYSISAKDLKQMAELKMDSDVLVGTDSVLHLSTLRTKWVMVPNRDGKLKFGFAYSSNNEQNVAKVTVRVIAPGGEQVYSEDVEVSELILLNGSD